MFFLMEPSSKTVGSFIASQKDLSFTYTAVGATAATPPANYTVDHNRIQLGHALDIYNRAVENLKRWRQFDLGWVEIVPAGVPLEVGSVVAVKARAYGTWSLNACRVVYLIDDKVQQTGKSFGFAYGTLPDHVESGEERFTIEWHPEDDTVWYDILAFSRPQHPLVRLTFPLARGLQKKFAHDSMKRMLKAVVETA